MIQKKNNSTFLLLLVLLLPGVAICQPTQKNKLELAAREIIKEAGNCALITVDETGKPRARTMDPFSPEDDFTVWFGTNLKSRKVKQIRKNANVTLYYFHKPSASYITINGTASIVEGGNEKDQYWKEEWGAFYPDYPQGYALIRVSPEWMEVISESRGITGDSKTWQPPIVQLDSVK
jgi:general stress protein 26